jgi:hypothetical protein
MKDVSGVSSDAARDTPGDRSRSCMASVARRCSMPTSSPRSPRSERRLPTGSTAATRGRTTVLAACPSPCRPSVTARVYIRVVYLTAEPPTLPQARTENDPSKQNISRKEANVLQSMCAVLCIGRRILNQWNRLTGGLHQRLSGWLARVGADVSLQVGRCAPQRRTVSSSLNPSQTRRFP